MGGFVGESHSQILIPLMGTERYRQVYISIKFELEYLLQRITSEFNIWNTLWLEGMLYSYFLVYLYCVYLTCIGFHINFDNGY